MMKIMHSRRMSCVGDGSGDWRTAVAAERGDIGDRVGFGVERELKQH